MQLQLIGNKDLDMLRRILRTTTLGLVSGALLWTSASVAFAEKFKAVTTFTVIADIAQNVAGDAATVESITKPGAEIHNYQPTPGDLIKAQDAKLVLWNGLGLELWFEKFFSRLKDVPSAVVSDGVEPIDISEGPYSGKPNPHAWMSPNAALIYVDNIRDAFVKMIRRTLTSTRRMQRFTKRRLKRRSILSGLSWQLFLKTSVGSFQVKAHSPIWLGTSV